MPPQDNSSAEGFDAGSRKEAEERLRLALDSVGDGAFDWSIRSGEVFCSDRWYEALGYRRGEFGPVTNVWREVLHPEDVAIMESAAALRNS